MKRTAARLFSILTLALLLLPSFPYPHILAQGLSRTFPESGHTVQGKFLQYWDQHGGLAQQGYPISEEMQEVSDTDGKTYTVQYFERAVFELHPENQPPNDVLLSLLGLFRYQRKYPQGAIGQHPNASPGAQLFQESGHTVGGRFLQYWQTHGGLAQQGYPISEEFTEVSDLDRKPYTVQYFQRAVFEYHPEQQPAYQVLLSQLGTFRFREQHALAGPDPDLEPGFPVKVREFPFESYLPDQLLQAYVLIGNIDDSPQPEILTTSPRLDRLYAWKADGSPVSGWPVGSRSTTRTSDYLIFGPALGLFSKGASRYSVFMAAWQSPTGGQPGVKHNLIAYSGSGAVLSGWPLDMETSRYSQPTIGDINRDGVDKVFVTDDKGTLHGLRADGSELSGWPKTTPGARVQAPALADLDGDGRLGVVASGGYHTGVLLQAYHPDGSVVSGYPVQVPSGQTGTSTRPAIGDVDGDGVPEIVAASARPDVPDSAGFLNIVSVSGAIKRTIRIPGPFGGDSIVPVLADLDCDGRQEIIVQSPTAIYAWRGDGTLMPGWPQVFWGNPASQAPRVFSAPVVGDVDGDGMPDVVSTIPTSEDIQGTMGSGEGTGTGAGALLDGEVVAYSRNGKMLGHFPKPLPLGLSAVPALADIDLDGRNEIIVSSTALYRGGNRTYQAPEIDKLWVYDLHGTGRYGAVQWGQFGGGAGHSSYVRPGTSCSP